MAHFSALLVVWHIIVLFSSTYAQNISTTTTIPPLQWINLSSFLQGSSAPPPLKDAAIGYDETSRSLIIFGGESESGFVQSQTYLLNLDTLTWSRPSPPSNLLRSPSARSASISGVDFAASNRHGFVVIGGKGTNGEGLSDVWEFDFINQFWSQVSISAPGPSGRWGAAGGIDMRTTPIQDPVVPGPNNTFYLAGGFDGRTAIPLSDVWRLNISGTLSSNLPDDSQGSWDHLTIGDLPPRVYQAGTMISQRIVAAGGCDGESDDDSCALGGAHVIDTQRQTSIAPAGCPAPRVGPTLVPNLSTLSSAFSSQVFMLLGTFNQSMWDDSEGLMHGEVAVLDSNTGAWSRVLPAGDPGTSGVVTYPTPRQGASAYSYPMALVGRDRSSSSDIIVYGGQDASGRFLSELWLLRAYAGLVSPSNPVWDGFGDGNLQTGINANGAGVRVDFLSTCARQIDNSTPPSSSPTPTPVPPVDEPASPDESFTITTSIIHKLLSPLSLAIFFPVALIFRLSPGVFPKAIPHIMWVYLASTSGLAAYAIGVVGLVFAFTTMSRLETSEQSPSTSISHLSTGHGRAGLALFVGLYGLLPILVVHGIYTSLTGQSSTVSVISTDKPVLPGEAADQQASTQRSTPQSIHTSSPPSSPPPRTHSWGPSSMWQRSLEGGVGSDTESMSSSGPQRTFEVLNRPARVRRESWNAVPLLATSAQYNLASRSLGDIDWLQRRRSLNTVGELDYALSQAHRAQLSSETNKAETNPPSISPLSTGQVNVFTPISVVRLLCYWSLLGLCAISLVMLWPESKAIFAVFLAWVVVFSLAHFILAWKGSIENSTLTAIFVLLRSTSPSTTAQSLNHHQHSSVSPPPRTDEYQHSAPLHGPYVHHPPFRTTHLGREDHSTINGNPRSVEDEDEDEDEETRQMRIEEEMGRREVSIVTIPKRKLWITNPS